MSQIIVEFDNNIPQSEIVMPLVNTSQEEGGASYESNKTDIQQTSVYGVQCPIISINNTIIDFDDIINFSLKSKDVLPILTLTVNDKYELINKIDSPGMDNEVRVQILPPFENVYKKINLTFYINKSSVNGNRINMNCMYKLPDFVRTRYECFGKVGTWEMFERIAKNTGLGFASNMKDCEKEDKRWVYCDYKSYKDLLEREVGFCGMNHTEIIDYWVDYWNNLNLVNVYDRYNHIDSDDDIQIWVSGQVKEMGQGQEVDPVQVAAVLNNHPASKTSELYVSDYKIVTNSGSSITDGTDVIYSIYENNRSEYVDHLVQDGDVKNDIYIKYDYLGETYGEYNYLLQKCLRRSFIKKMKSEYLQIELKTPMFGLMRGGKVNFISYSNDSMLDNKKEILNENGIGVYNTSIETYSEESESKSDSGQWTVDSNVSGQYLIIGSNIMYYNKAWHYELMISRPADQKIKLY